MVFADPRPLMVSAGSSRVCLVSFGGYLPFLEESPRTGSGRDLVTGWGARDARMPGHRLLADPLFTTSYFRDVLERLSKLSSGQMAIPWALVKGSNRPRGG
jgi:hypothetical protein